MSYTHAHYSSRTAGGHHRAAAGASFNNNVLSNGRGTLSPNQNTTVQTPKGSAHSPNSAAPRFDALLQEANAHPQTDTPPSGFAPKTPLAAGSQTSEFQKQDQLNAGFRTPHDMNDANKPTQNERADSRTANRTVSTKDRAAYNADGEEIKFTIWDFLDMINPLQHIPIVSNIYRSLTGDEISSHARIMGGAVYGGPIGAAAGVANAVVAEANGGEDIGETVVSLVSGRKRPVESLVENADFAATQNSNFNISKDDIKWSHPSDTLSPSNTPRLNEEIKAGSAPAAPSPSPSNARGASRSFPFTQTIQNQFLSQAHPTHTHPTHAASDKSGVSATPSLHMTSDAQPNGAEPRSSVAAQAGERNRKEISYARQENTGSPLTPSLHTVQAARAESATLPEPAAITDKMDLHLKMMAGLEKYQAMKTAQ